MATTPTNNPIPSEDPRDLKFNAGKVDEEVNGSADYYTDRFGVQRLTNTGRNSQFQDAQTQRESDFVASQTDKEERFQQFLLNSGYQFLGDYENGPYTITARNQIIRYQGELWRLNASTTPPYTTTGINSTSWAVDVTHLVSVGDATLRQELATTGTGNGSEMVAHRGRTVKQRFDDEVSLLDFGAANQAGTAMNAAIDYLNAIGGGTIYIPPGSYTQDVPVVKTLSGHIEIRASKRADIVVNTAMDVWTINSGDYCLTVNGLTFTASLPALDTTHAFIRQTGQTLRQSLVFENNTIRRTGSNNMAYGVYGVALNAVEFLNNHISAVGIPLHNESSLLNSSATLIANAMEMEFSGNKVYNAGAAGIEIVNKGYYGCEGIVVTRNKIICSGSAISVTADASLRGAYMPPLLQVSDNHFNAYRALYLEKVSRVFFHSNDVQSKFRADDAINGIFEFYSCQGWTITDTKITAVSQDGSVRANVNTPIYLGDLDASLPNAFGELNNVFFWIDNATTNNFVIASSTALTGRITYGKCVTQSLGAIVNSTYKYNFDISKDTILRSQDANQGIGYISSDTMYSYNSGAGVLTIVSRGQYNDLHVISAAVVPAGSAINQIVANNTYGRRLNIQFAAAEVRLNHNANLTLPDGVSCIMWGPTYVTVEMFTDSTGRVWSIAGTSQRRPMRASKPTSGSPGLHGDWYFASNVLTEFIPGFGWYDKTLTPVT